VRLQLRSDVPVGRYLSGGLDSAIVRVRRAQLSTRPLRTFSLTFEDAEFDESAQQRELVAYLGTEHTSIRCTRADIAAAFPRTVCHAETPDRAHRARAAHAALGPRARSGFKVVLTGEGADEVFGGYDLFKEAKIAASGRARPARRGGHASWSALSLPRKLARLRPRLHPGVLPRRHGARCDAVLRAHAALVHHRAHRALLLAGAARRRWRWDPYAAVAATLPEGIERWVPMGRDQYVEAHTLMSGYLLSLAGATAWRWPTRSRAFPVPRPSLIEFANRLPPQLKLRGLTEKYLLEGRDRRAARAGRTRTKQPYRAPDSQSFFFDGRAGGLRGRALPPAKLAAGRLFRPAAAGMLYA
jgi:asparagine synthase (glutamine-hydrolysing)